MAVFNGSLSKSPSERAPAGASVKVQGKAASRAVHSITGAPSSLKDDVMSREKRYLISMAIRTACFIGAIVTPGPLRWVLLAGAVFLPYVAVVLANIGRSPGKQSMTPYVPSNVTAPKQLTEKTSGHD